MTNLVRYTALVLVSAACLSAAPKLRLSLTTIGPVNIAPGANGPPQLLQASNLGTGKLSLSAASSASWLAAKLQPDQSCYSGPCTPITLSLNTAGLAAGMHTGIVTISDPAAIDSPQTITVTVAIGGNIPSQLDLYAQPGGSASATFLTDNPVNASAATQTGGKWLTVALSGQGTFAFNVPYKISATAIAGLGAGNYKGTVKTAGSHNALDNTTVNVTLHVTTSPIIDLAGANLTFTVGQGMSAQSQYVNVNNAGQGTLTIADTKATADQGTWLSAKAISGTPLVQLTADPKNLGPGAYTGSVTVDSNAANGAVVVPVTLNVIAEGSPVITIPGVLNPASYVSGEPLSQGDIALVKGDWLHSGDAVVAKSTPLPTELGADNVKVLVNGTASPLFYVSFGQINFQIPFETPLGDATVQVVANGKNSNIASIQILARQPRILQFCYASNYCPSPYGIGINTDNTYPIAATASIFTDRVKRAAKANDVIVFYAVGLGQTTPPQITGAAAGAKPLGVVVPKYNVCFGEPSKNPVCVAASYSGVTPAFVGLYQINVRIPASAPKGDQVPMYIENQGSSTPVIMSIQ